MLMQPLFAFVSDGCRVFFLVIIVMLFFWTNAIRGVPSAFMYKQGIYYRQNGMVQ
jgi:hypothetical protein